MLFLWLLLFLLLGDEFLLSLELFKLFFLGFSLGGLFLLLEFLGLFGRFACGFLLSLLSDRLFLFKSLLLLLRSLHFHLLLLQLLALLPLLLLLVLLGFALSVAKCFTFKSLRLFLLLKSFFLELSLFFLLLTLSISLGSFKPLELLLDLQFFILGCFSLLSFLHQWTHTLRSESFKLLLATGFSEIGKLSQDYFGCIPGRSQITFTLFFNDDLLEDSLDGLLAALWVLIIEVIDDLLLGLERGVASTDELGSELENRIRVTLSEIIDLLGLFNTQRHAEAIKCHHGEVFEEFW